MSSYQRLFGKGPKNTFKNMASIDEETSPQTRVKGVVVILSIAALPDDICLSTQVVYAEMPDTADKAKIMTTDNNAESIDMTRWVISIAVPALAGLVGVLIGAWLASRQQKEQRKLAFIEKQLKYFYSPLLGIRNEIRMLSELRVKISGSASDLWHRICEDARERGGADEVHRVTAERWEVFERSIEYDNRQLAESLLPSYRRMASIFRDNYYLAEEQTQKYYRFLLEFVDIWYRCLNESVPYEVAADLGHSEESLHSFYEDLENTHNELRTKLVAGQA